LKFERYKITTNKSHCNKINALNINTKTLRISLQKRSEK